jgi:hypothetical protein
MTAMWRTELLSLDAVAMASGSPGPLHQVKLRFLLLDKIW